MGGRRCGKGWLGSSFRRRSMRPVVVTSALFVGFIAKTYTETLLVDEIDASGDRVTVDTYMKYLVVFISML